MRAAFLGKPYGDAAKVTETGEALVHWTDDKLIAGLTKSDGAGTRYDIKAALALLKQLANDAASPAPGKTPDYDAARQTAWTFRAIYDDVTRALKESKDDGETAKAGQTLLANQKAIQQQMDKLDGALNLILPNANAATERRPRSQSRQRSGGKARSRDSCRRC